MADTLTAYFLCAGYGQRLRPLTDRIPKPALTFQGKTALEINYRLALPLYPGRVLCNAHHLYADMEKAARRFGMQVLYEREILGTAGCLWNARHLLSLSDHFLVHNGDLIHTINLRSLLRRHLESENIATLAGVFRPTHNTLSCDAEGLLLGVHGFDGYGAGDKPSGFETTRLTFAGIAVYNREFLEFGREGPEDIKRYWMDALGAGKSIGVMNCSQDAAWFDFGSPQGLWEAAKFAMDWTQDYSYRYFPLVREARAFVANEAGQEDLPELLRNVLIYEETPEPILPGTSNCIIGRDFRWEIQP